MERWQGLQEQQMIPMCFWVYLRLGLSFNCKHCAIFLLLAVQKMKAAGKGYWKRECHATLSHWQAVLHILQDLCAGMFRNMKRVQLRQRDGLDARFEHRLMNRALYLQYEDNACHWPAHLLNLCFICSLPVTLCCWFWFTLLIKLLILKKSWISHLSSQSKTRTISLSHT